VKATLVDTIPLSLVSSTPLVQAPVLPATKVPAAAKRLAAKSPPDEPNAQAAAREAIVTRVVLVTLRITPVP